MKVKIEVPSVEYIVSIVYVIVTLFMPNFIMNYTTIYSINAEKHIAIDAYVRGNPWLYYSFSFLEIFALLYGIIHKPQKGNIDIRPMVGLIIIFNIVRMIFGLSSIFYFGDYSLILSLLVGFGCYQMVINRPINMDLESVLDFIIIVNAFTQVLFIITGRMNEYGGRYPALGSNVGEVGTICFTYLIYYIFAREKNNNSIIPFLCCIFSFVVSGSRSNILFAALFIVVFFFQYRKGMALSSSKRKAMKVLLIGLIIIVPVLVYMDIGTNDAIGTVVNRISGFFVGILGQNRGSYLQSDQSFVQRLASFAAGWNIIKENPLGISASTIDLQMCTQANGYYTFPHSSLISYYLLWGLVGLAVYAWIIKTMIVGIKRKKSAWVILACLSIVFVIYGGPIINSKTYFWYIVLFAFCKKVIYRETV